jgi:hypothetical protein
MRGIAGQSRPALASTSTAHGCANEAAKALGYDAQGDNHLAEG